MTFFGWEGDRRSGRKFTFLPIGLIPQATHKQNSLRLVYYFCTRCPKPLHIYRKGTTKVSARINMHIHAADTLGHFGDICLRACCHHVALMPSSSLLRQCRWQCRRQCIWLIFWCISVQPATLGDIVIVVSSTLSPNVARVLQTGLKPLDVCRSI